MIDFTKYLAGIWRGKQQILKPVSCVDKVDINSLIGIEEQKNLLIENTKNFLDSKPFNHALLWGSRGTGKSALIKAMLSLFYKDGLRIIELSKVDLDDLPYIVDEVRELDFKFVIFCDDLSFERDEWSYFGLKPILEGSVEKFPENIVVYATSNRTNLENVGKIDELGSFSDVMEEKISLADCFGLWIAFHQGDFDDYYEIIDSYFKDFDADKFALYEKAKKFSLLRGSRSGRTAKQFYNLYKDFA